MSTKREMTYHIQFEAIEQPRVWKLTSTLQNPRHIFGDGSGYFSNEVLWRVVAWAIYDVATGESTSARLVGIIQTVCRAEITAGLYAMFAAFWVHVYSDHKNFVDGVKEIHADPAKPIPLTRENHDLWVQVRQTILDRPSGAITVHKVKAHSKLPAGATDQQLWEKKHNDTVDELAKKANKNRTQEFWREHATLRSAQLTKTTNGAAAACKNDSCNEGKSRIGER